MYTTEEKENKISQNDYPQIGYDTIFYSQIFFLSRFRSTLHRFRVCLCLCVRIIETLRFFLSPSLC